MAQLLIARFEGGRRFVALAVLVSVLGLSVVGAACSPPTDPTPRPPTPASFRLTGIIVDATSAPISGAVVEAKAVADESAPPVATTVAEPDGRYRLDGVPSVSYVRVTQYGYFGAVDRVELTADGTRDFNITRDLSAPDYAGSYTLTIDADAACPSAPSPLPPNLRRRTFPARIEQVASRLTLTVGPPCINLGNEGGCVIDGRASTSGATFQLTEGPDLGYLRMPDLVEGLSTFFGDRQGLWFAGTATTNLSEAGLLGSLAGTITHHAIVFPSPAPNPSTAGCRAGRFELTRR
jgi:hypothetical protein